MDKELLNEINAAYYRLEMKQAEIAHALLEKYLNLNPVGITDTTTKKMLGNGSRNPILSQ